MPGPPQAVWDLLVDARHHAAWIPLTRVEADGPPALGTRVVAVSGPGARRGGPGLVDRMRIVRLDPPGPGRPGVAVFAKVGPVLGGEARIEVADEAGASSAVWTEQVHLRGAPAGLSSWLLVLPLRAMTALALARAARELHATRHGPA